MLVSTKTKKLLYFRIARPLACAPDRAETQSMGRQQDILAGGRDRAQVSTSSTLLSTGLSTPTAISTGARRDRPRVLSTLSDGRSGNRSACEAAMTSPNYCARFRSIPQNATAAPYNDSARRCRLQ